jgi:hypothetical protein
MENSALPPWVMARVLKMAEQVDSARPTWCSFMTPYVPSMYLYVCATWGMDPMGT